MSRAGRSARRFGRIVVALLSLLLVACSSSPTRTDSRDPVETPRLERPAPLSFEQAIDEIETGVLAHFEAVTQAGAMATVLCRDLAGVAPGSFGRLGLREQLRNALNKRLLGRVRFVTPDGLGAIAEGTLPELVDAILSGEVLAPEGVSSPEDGGVWLHLQLASPWRSTARWDRHLTIQPPE